MDKLDVQDATREARELGSRTRHTGSRDNLPRRHQAGADPGDVEPSVRQRPWRVGPALLSPRTPTDLLPRTNRPPLPPRKERRPRPGPPCPRSSRTPSPALADKSDDGPDTTAWRSYAALVVTGLGVPLAYWGWDGLSFVPNAVEGQSAGTGASIEIASPRVGWLKVRRGRGARDPSLAVGGG